MVRGGVGEGTAVWVEWCLWGGEGHEDFRVGVVFGAGVVAGTEINRGLMMAMVMEAHGHFLESLCG